MTDKFPLDVSAYRPLTLNPKKPLDEGTLAQWQTNIHLVRDTIIFFTASAGLRGVDGHTGGLMTWCQRRYWPTALSEGRITFIPFSLTRRGTAWPYSTPWRRSMGTSRLTFCL